MIIIVIFSILYNIKFSKKKNQIEYLDTLFGHNNNDHQDRPTDWSLERNNEQTLTNKKNPPIF